MKKGMALFIMMLVVFALIVGIFVGRYAGHSMPNEKKPMYWVDTMEPTVHYPGPGKSHMGMELVPVYPEGQEGNQSSVRISPTVINNLGVRTAPVIQGTLARRIEAVGYVEPNENKISHIHSYTDGWVRKLFVNTVGAPVKAGQVLLQLYSPILINAQEEYLIALGSRDLDLADASIKKLQALHISEKQIQQLKNTKKSSQLVDIESPQDGVVAGLNIREGMRVTPDIEMMSLVDLSSVWMIAQVFEDQANWVKVGEFAEAKLSALPDKTWKGEVEYVYPQVDSITRTLKVRFRFNNPDGVLKPNMYASISLFAEPKLNVLSIPLEALIRSSQGNRVIASLGDGRFQVRPITTGMESGDQVEILSGLHAGERVVASGQFLIDSEANLKAGLERVEAPPQSTTIQNTTAAWSDIIIEGKGIIMALNVSQDSLTLQHEPISVLSWPEMTMDFSVEKEVNLNQFKMGDHVKFTLKQAKNNQYVITDMKKLAP
jgi:Cu(I)/Ag(I) efflux system membrane fusion protein